MDIASVGIFLWHVFLGLVLFACFVCSAATLGVLVSKIVLKVTRLRRTPVYYENALKDALKHIMEDTDLTPAKRTGALLQPWSKEWSIYRVMGFLVFAPKPEILNALHPHSRYAFVRIPSGGISWKWGWVQNVTCSDYEWAVNGNETTDLTEYSITTLSEYMKKDIEKRPVPYPVEVLMEMRNKRRYCPDLYPAVDEYWWGQGQVNPKELTVALEAETISLHDAHILVHHAHEFPEGIQDENLKGIPLSYVKALIGFK